MDHRTIMQGVIVRIAVSVFGLLTVAMLLLAVYNDKGYFAVHAQALKLKAIQENIKTLENENKGIQRREQSSWRMRILKSSKSMGVNLGLVEPDEVIINVR